MVRHAAWILVVVLGCGESKSSAPAAPPAREIRDAALAERMPDVDLPAAWPTLPDWERAHLAVTHWEDLLGRFPRDVSARLDAITDVVALLPEDDPRYVEARCTAGRAASFGRAQDNFQKALGVLRAKQPAPRAAYGSLLERMFAVELSWEPANKGHAIAATTLRMGGSCDAPDLATLELELLDAFQRIGDRPKAGPKPALRKPASTRKLTPRLGHVVALREEVEAAVGREHPYAAAMEELVAVTCDAPNRKRDPAACPTIAAAFQRGLEVRIARLGEHHPATRDALLRVAVERLNAGALAEAASLLARAAAGPPIDRTRITAALLLAGIELARGNKVGALDRARVAAPAAATARHGDHVFVAQCWTLLAEIAAAAGDPGVAARARDMVALPQAPTFGTLALAQMLDEAGKRDRAAQELDGVVAVARADAEAGPPELAAEARGRLREALRWRAAFHRRHRDAARADADVAAIRALDARQP